MIVINFSQIPWAPLVTQMVKTLCNTGDLGLIPGLEPTPVFLPEESHGQRSLAGYSPWGIKELDYESLFS